MAEYKVEINAKASVGYDKLYPLTKLDNMATTLTVNNWIAESNNYKQTVSITGIEVTGYDYIVSPSPNNYNEYGESGVYMKDPINENSATFYCEEKPTIDLVVNILKVGV